MISAEEIDLHLKDIERTGATSDIRFLALIVRTLVEKEADRMRRENAAAEAATFHESVGIEEPRPRMIRRMFTAIAGWRQRQGPPPRHRL